MEPRPGGVENGVGVVLFVFLLTVSGAELHRPETNRFKAPFAVRRWLSPLNQFFDFTRVWCVVCTDLRAWRAGETSQDGLFQETRLRLAVLQCRIYIQHGRH